MLIQPTTSSVAKVEIKKPPLKYSKTKRVYDAHRHHTPHCVWNKALIPEPFFHRLKKIGSYRLIVRSSLAVYNDSIYQKSDFVKRFF